jgi:hypothetical protein
LSSFSEGVDTVELGEGLGDGRAVGARVGLATGDGEGLVPGAVVLLAAVGDAEASGFVVRVDGDETAGRADDGDTVGGDTPDGPGTGAELCGDVTAGEAETAPLLFAVPHADMSNVKLATRITDAPIAGLERPNRVPVSIEFLSERPRLSSCPLPKNTCLQDTQMIYRMFR